MPFDKPAILMGVTRPACGRAARARGVAGREAGVKPGSYLRRPLERAARPLGVLNAGSGLRPMLIPVRLN